MPTGMTPDQIFSRFTTTISELLGSINTVVEDSRVPPEVIDNVSDIVIGLQQYVETRGKEIAESAIPRSGPSNLQQNVGILIIGDDYTIQLPKYVGWEPGDRLEWEIIDANTAIVQKLD